WYVACSHFSRVLEYADIPHLGGGRKGLFLLLRYVFIVAASYLLLFQVPGQMPLPSVAVVIATALASNVAFSFVPAQHMLSWYLGAPVLVADTLWVSWALHSTGAAGQEVFLLYSFVFFLAMLGESLPVMLLGSGFLCAASFIFVLPDGDPGRTSAERDQMVVRIRKASHTLLQLVDDVLDLRRLESGKVPLEIEPVHLARFIGHFQRRERMPVAPNVALCWRIDPVLPEIETDAAKLSIV